MKRLNLLLSTLLTLLAALLFASCEKNTDTIKDYDKDKLSITTYADDTEVKGGFSFTATEAWTTAIDYGENVRSGSNNWVTLDPASGNAGEVTITITLDENLTGENRNATIRIICGETTLTITIEQRGSENPGNNNGTQENDSTSTGDDPIQNEKIYAINKINIDINESESQNITYYFYHKNNDPRCSINRVVVEGLTESGTDVEYILNYESDKLNIETHLDGILYETIEANINNLYIDNYTYIETLEEMDASEGTTYEGISKETYNFYREGGKLYKTSRRKEIIFEGKPSWNLESEETYNLTWEYSDTMSDAANDIFDNPFNLTEISWSEENGDTYDYFTYNHNITLANVQKGLIKPITEPGSFVDLNYIIANLWVSGIYYAYGSNNNGIIGLLGLTSAPNYNFVNFVTYRQVDGDYVHESNGCNIYYELDENNLIKKVYVGGEIIINVDYQIF